MSFKVGTPTSISISNIADKTKETEVKRFDTNRDGKLDINEASAFHASKAPGSPQLRSIDEALRHVGGLQHKIDTFHRGEYETLNYTHAPNWKGNFNIPGLGAGNIRVGRETNSYNNTDRFNVLVNCDLMNFDFIDKGIKSATLVMGPKDFAKEADSDVGEAVEIPMNIATAPGYNSYSRGGGSSWVPEKKYLAASMDPAGLRELAGGKDMSFYIRLEGNDGKTHYINKDGQPFRNFEISASEVKDLGNP